MLLCKEPSNRTLPSSELELRTWEERSFSETEHETANHEAGIGLHGASARRDSAPHGTPTADVYTGLGHTACHHVGGDLEGDCV